MIIDMKRINSKILNNADIPDTYLVWLDKVHPEGLKSIDYIEEIDELYPSDFKYTINDLNLPTILELPPFVVLPVNLNWNNPTAI